MRRALFFLRLLAGKGGLKGEMGLGGEQVGEIGKITHRYRRFVVRNLWYTGNICSLN